MRKDVLNHLGVRPGEKLAVQKLPDGRIEMRAERASGRICEVFNLLEKRGQPKLSLDEIAHVVTRGWAGRK
jgi:hypothetical protein